jgi:Holliday junction resolvasome RuvABC endonuclease subunit
MKGVFIGIDMSLCNAGVSCIDEIQNTITLYFWRNRVCERSFTTRVDRTSSKYYNWILQMVCIERKEEPREIQSTANPEDLKSLNYQKYLSLVTKIVSIVEIHSKRDPMVTRVAIEGYAFNSRGSFSTTVLYELGGLLRTFLSVYGHKFTEYSPAQVKKTFSGSGRSLKIAMYTSFTDLHGLPDLARHLNIDFSKTKNLHPVEDVVDAFAVAYTASQQAPL